MKRGKAWWGILYIPYPEEMWLVGPGVLERLDRVAPEHLRPDDPTAYRWLVATAQAKPDDQVTDHRVNWVRRLDDRRALLSLRYEWGGC